MAFSYIRSPLVPRGALFFALALTGCAGTPAFEVSPRPEAASDAQPTRPGKVLMLLTAAQKQTLAEGGTRETGFFLNEFFHPYRALIEAGYAVIVATPGGHAPALDPESLKDRYWADELKAREEALAVLEEDSALQEPWSLEHALVRAEEFQAVLVPGGQGVMVDLLDNEHVHGLLTAFGTTDRPVGLICHAPALLTRSTRTRNVFAGRQVTSVSAIEEWYIETFVMGENAKVRQIGHALDESGLRHAAGFPGRAHAVRDCNLVTSQNPFSGAAFNRLFLDALDDWRRGGRCLAATAS